MSLPPTKAEIQLPKKAFTALDLRAWVERYRDSLVGGYISNVNVYRLGEGRVYVLRVRTKDAGLRQLAMQPSARVHFTAMKMEAGVQDVSEASSLRRLVRDKRIAGVAQVGFDRIIEISLHDGFKIVLELLPRGELAVLDSAGVIRYASEYRTMKDRKIAPGVPYVYPPLVSEVPSLESCTDDSPVLAGLPKEVLLEARSRSASLCEGLRDVFGEALRGEKGYIALREGVPVYFSPFRPTFLEQKGMSVEEKGDFNEAVDFYFSTATREALAAARAEEIRALLDKLSKTLEKERARAAQFLEEAAFHKKIADALMLNREVAERALECARSAIDRGGWESVVRECGGLVERANPSAGKVFLKLGDAEVSIDLRKPVKAQISEHYEEYKKLKSKYEKSQQALADLERKLAEKRVELEEVVREVSRGFRKTYWYERYVWSFTRRRLLVLAGRDFQQNESLVKKHLEDGDYFLHADIHGGAATILKTGGSEASEEDLLDAATIAACFSKAWKAGYGSVDVFYVKGSQVSKTPPPGEYLPPGSFMVYGKKGYLKNVPLELAFGIETTEEGGFRFTIGSKESVEARGVILGLLYPGDSPPSKVAERIRKAIKQEGLHYVPTQSEVERLLPGPSKIKFIRETKFSEESGVR